MMIIKNERTYFEYIDKIKGIAIVLVVVGHALAWNIEDHTSVILTHPKQDMFWWHFIYAFHMPLFFWVSGFLFPNKEFKLCDFPNFVWKKTYTLLLCCFPNNWKIFIVY